MIIFVINNLPSTAGIFFLLSNFCNPPVVDQMSPRFYRKNAESPGFENFRLAGMKNSFIFKVSFSAK